MASGTRQEAIEDTFRSLGHVMSWLQGCLRATFAGEGVSMGQMGILRVLVKRGTATPKELAEMLRVTTGDVTGLVDKLEGAGLVKRRRSRKDRRVVHVEPTAKALERFKQLRKASIELLSEAFSGWTVAEIQDFDQRLEKLAVAGRPPAAGALEARGSVMSRRPRHRG